MIERGVWRKTDRKKIPNNRRLIGNKWVFKIKRDGTFRARLVALGYSQIRGVDYTDNFAPIGTPRFTARRLENPEDKVNPEDHETCRSGVGTLLYLTKHSRPDICNPVRELSKTMDEPAPVHLKEMYKVIRNVLSTKRYGLKFELRKDMIKWALKALSYRDFASDKETRISVLDTSYISVESQLLG